MSDIPTMNQIYRPIFLIDNLGELGRMPDGAIINSGGVSGPNFLVGGKPLLFADGTATDGSEGLVLNIDLQGVYTNSAAAQINFTTGKDLILNAINNKQFVFDADTGAVTITGDLTVIGTTTTVDNTVTNVEKIAIRPVDGTLVPFILEPMTGVVPTVNLVDIKATNGGSSVFTIGPTGNTYIQSLEVGDGLFNGINVGELEARLTAHENLAAIDIKHRAVQVSAQTAGLDNISGDNVQEVIESIDQAISNITSTVANSVQTYEHVQEMPDATWTVQHNKGSTCVQITLWDDTNEIIYADSVKIIDQNTVAITYNTPITGRAILITFNQPL